MDPERKFTKSSSNRRTENAGLAVLLQDSRFQRPELAARRRILDLLPVKGEFGIRTFDAVMTPTPVEPIVVDSVERHFSYLTLIEMKTTQEPIQDRRLNGFFFGATKAEYAMAEALGDRYLFAFVVLNSNNAYGHPFFVLLPLREVMRRTKVQRMQYQVNFRTDIVGDDALDYGLGPEIPG